MVKQLIVTFFCLVLMPALVAAAIEVRSDRNPVGLNESFQLIYETSGDVDDDPDFSVLESVVDILNRAQSSNISILNGEYRSSKSWTLTVMARREGLLQIPRVPFGRDSSPGLDVQVNAPSQAGSGGPEFSAVMRVSSEQLYRQQQLLVTLQMRSPFSLSGYAMGELNVGGVDVVVEPLGEEKQYRTRIGDDAFIVVEKRYALFPQQSGTLTIDPVLVEARSGSRSGVFDPFANRGRILRARTNGASITVSPEPVAAGVSPWLPASDVQLLEQWPQDPPQFRVGEPVTRTLSVKAEGLSAAQLPELPLIQSAQVKQYPDQPILENIRNDNGITGYRVEKTAFVPTQPGNLVLPAIEIRWWNTRTGQVEVSRIPARSIDVAAADMAQSSEPSVNSATDRPIATSAIPDAGARDDAPAASQTGSLSAPTQDYWIWIAAIALLGWLATAVSWWMFGQRRLLPPSQDSPTQAPSIGVEVAAKQVLNACRERNAQACRSSLLQWAEQQFERDRVEGLGQLSHWVPNPLSQLLRDLDASLYAARPHAVDFEQLAAAFKQFTADAARARPAVAADALQPLYK